MKEIEKALKVKPFWWYWLHPEQRRNIRQQAYEIVAEVQDYRKNWATAEGEPHELTQGAEEGPEEELRLEL